jgi:hypothetical protein
VVKKCKYIPMKDTIFDNISYEDERLYNNIKQTADRIFGPKDTLSKKIYIINTYKLHNAKYTINPKRKIKDKSHSYLSRVKKKKSNQSKLKVNVSRAARQFLLTQQIKEVQANQELTQEERDWISIDLDYLTNCKEEKVIEYIRAAAQNVFSVEFLDKKAYKDVRDKVGQKFGPESSQDVRDLYTYRTYKNLGLPIKYDSKVVAPTNNAPQGLAPESSTWLPRAADDDLRFKSFIQSSNELDTLEKADMLAELENLNQERNKYNKALEEKMNKEITFQQFPQV